MNTNRQKTLTSVTPKQTKLSTANNAISITMPPTYGRGSLSYAVISLSASLSLAEKQ